MNPHTVFNAACYGLVLLGGLALFIAPFTARGRVAPHWMRVALWLCCPIAVAWSALGFILLFGSATLSEHAYFVIRQTKTLFAGMGIGILVLLFASGQFIRAFSSPTAVSDS
jgi:hypothetical protein